MYQGHHHPTATSRPLLQDVLELLFKIVLILGVACLLLGFVFGLVRMPDNSMDPNIKDGDLILCYRLDRDYVAGDVLSCQLDGKQSVARVVAVAGDEVSLDESGLIVNGNHSLDEDAVGTTLPVEGGVELPVRVPEGSVFLLSDNREEGYDSRMVGCVSERDTMGTVVGLFRRRDL